MEKYCTAFISKVKEIQADWGSMKSHDGPSCWTPSYDEFIAELYQVLSLQCYPNNSSGSLMLRIYF